MHTFTLTWTITADGEGLLIRDYLRAKGISKAALTDIKFRGGSITVDGQTVNVRHKLRAGEALTISYPPEERSEGMQGEDIPLDILYEDESVLVLNKRPYMATIPSREHQSGTVAHALLHHYDRQGLSSTIHIVTRLDRDTSGVMLVAKNRFVHHLLSQQQVVKAVRRTYEALVHGVMAADQGIIDAPIARKTESIIERVVREDGQHAVTHYRVLERKADLTYVELELETGRTHQIRVHLAYLGHPLLGDDLYGGRLDVMDRQALHSRTLTFFHPVLERAMTFTAELPADMKAVLQE
ncbi:RluA family pseudouridine synthase [Ectobacillus ponti]|uniref:Pseudouridine synthase n=1 Tax=Ectobacillus ponti TaxID=2961894 RepID=A0AA41X3L7_9BACI|nr:RluA family pseudouridine synthase [Ectobacillus ponti]MCP8968324.1 RluA family pseudouridine synthase [Ectobacillus ponti]